MCGILISVLANSFSSLLSGSKISFHRPEAARDRSGSRQKLLSPRSRFVSKGRQKKAKKQWDEDHRRISVARDVHNSWRKMKCVCVYSSDTAFAKHLLSLEMRLRVG